MKAEKFIIKQKHDTGAVRLKVVSLSGEQGAIAQVLKNERCPESAISKIRKAIQQ